MTNTSIYTEDRLRRRYSGERWSWTRAAYAMYSGAYPNDLRFTSRPYLLAHLEHEIAAVGTHIGVAYCAACDITYKAPGTAYAGTWVFEAGKRMAAAYRFINEHNALIHPRRAARLTK